MRIFALIAFCISSLIAYSTVQSFDHSAEITLEYVDRAESNLLTGKFEKALDDLEKSYEIAWQLDQKQIARRTLINMMVAYAHLGDDDKALLATEHFQNLLDFSDQHKGCLCKD